MVMSNVGLTPFLHGNALVPGGGVQVMSGDTVLQEDDLLTILGEQDEMKALQDLFQMR